MGKYPSFNCRQLERRLREIGCEHLRNTGSHRHYSNPFRPDRIITFSWHPGDVPRGIIADIIEDLGISASPATNSISGNFDAAREKPYQRALHKLSWRSIIVWECQTEKPKTLGQLSRKLTKLLGA